MKTIPNKIYLEESELPKKWYNLIPDLPTELAPQLNPQTKKPIQKQDMEPIFAKALIEQELSTERYIDIPEEVLRMYKTFRPSPLCRAYNLEKYLDTPAHIYYKYEGNNPSGSHKLNSAIPQVYYNMLEGKKRISTETGAGQWGTALSIACSYYGMDCTVYMVKSSSLQKPHRALLMQTYGAKVIQSPSTLTEAGRKILEKYPDTGGSLGIAISEAVEDAAMHEDTSYCLGSVLNHVVLHQSIIGLEAQLQFEKIDVYPDIVIGCCGGGSNIGGTATPFLRDKFVKGTNVRIIGVEPTACPTLTRGVFAYDYGDTAMIAPICKMYTLGHGFLPPGIHAGGLRYHGLSPIMSQICHEGYMEARAVKQRDVFEAAQIFATQEIILPAPESAHAIRVAIDEALECKRTGEKKTIMFTLTGNGYFDMKAYENYLTEQIVDVEYTDEQLQEFLKDLPEV